MKEEINQLYMQYYVKKSQYFTDKNQLLYFKCRKNGKCAGHARPFVNILSNESTSKLL